jgi:DNA polymerase III alpha subunit
MRLDRFDNPIFNEKDIFDALYQGHTDILEKITVDTTTDIKQLASISNVKVLDPISLEESISVDEFDFVMQTNWFMPEEYKNIDIKSWLIQKCQTNQEQERVLEELEAYQAKNMLTLLNYLKYLVDTLSEHNIVWGIGRGSSVASFVLFLIGIHSINSMKYNLDWREFLR